MTKNWQWVCGYRGETDIRWRGKNWAIRLAAVPGQGQTATSEDGYYNGDYYRTGILPCVGTVRAGCCGDYHAFPPRELVEELQAEYPGVVAARWNEDFTELLYDGDKPATVVKHGDVFAASYAAYSLARWGY